MSPSSMSDSKEACVRAIRSASPVVSTTTLAKTAWRPSLLSKIAPLTALPSRMGAAAKAWSSSRSGRAAADNQHVGLGKDGNFAGRLEVGSRGPRALLAPRLTAEELDSLLGAYGVAQVARAGTVLEDFRLEEEASAVFGAFVV